MATMNKARARYNHLLAQFGRVSKNTFISDLTSNNIPIEKIGKGYVIVDGLKFPCKITTDFRISRV